MHEDEGGGTSYELGTGDGTVAGRGYSKKLVLSIVKNVPLAALAYECSKKLGSPMGCGAQGECQTTEGAAQIATCNCHETLIDKVGARAVLEAAAPHVAANVPATGVPVSMLPAIKHQISRGIVPRGSDPAITKAKARNEVTQAILTGRALPKSAAELSAQVRGLGAVGWGNGRRGTIVRRSQAMQFGEQGDDEVQTAKTGISTWWGEFQEAGKVPPKAAAKAAASGWPPPAAYRPGNWDFDASTYVLAFGDTLSGLAITYLGSPQRWKEIWDAQPQDFRFSHSPDKLMAGQKINMPLEARDMAKAMLADPNANPQASTIGKKAPIDVPGENPNAPTVAGGTSAATEAKGKKLIVPLAIGAGVLGGGYLLWKAVS